MKHKLGLGFLFSFLFMPLLIASPKQEVRSVWMATVYGIDWPNLKLSSSPTAGQVQSQKDRLCQLLDSLQSGNMNACYFQVRSRSDAMYKSSYEPWSSDLIETRGAEPSYDPLAFAVEEAHKRGIELHAWVNPYRFESTAGQWAGQAGDYATTHPDWVVRVGDATILNPGIPAVRDRISDIVKEIVTNYDIDGIVFDDYFYLKGITTQDQNEQDLYKPASQNVGDWRRENVNKMIAQVNRTIKSIKPHVRFGVSPAGIWGGPAEDYGVTNPSGISSGYAYNGIYCDPLAWMRDKSLDYISPQIYWTIGSGSTDYAVLSEWWSEMAATFNTHFYSSHSLSAMSNAYLSARSPLQVNEQEMVSPEGLSSIEMAALVQGTRSSFPASELVDQIDCNRKYDQLDAFGSVFYSAKSYIFKAKSVAYLKQHSFQHAALMPTMFGFEMQEFAPVANIVRTNGSLSWDAQPGDVRYMVYAIPTSVFTQGANVQGVATYQVGMTYEPVMQLPISLQSTDYTYAVSVVDRFGLEHAAGVSGKSVQTMNAASALYPANGGDFSTFDSFTWTPTSGADQSIVEVSEDASFSVLCARRATTANAISAQELFRLENGKSYYWRVRSRKAGYADALTAPQMITSVGFQILYPANLQDDVPVSALLQWSTLGEGVTCKLEIATSSTFVSSSVVLTRDVVGDSYQVQNGELQANKTYYMRISRNDGDLVFTSATVEFSTVNGSASE